MPIISLIAAIDENYGLGKDNRLLCHLPADLKHFKSITMGKPVIMGRNTFVSIGKPLPGRQNIVLSRQERVIEGVDVVDSLNQALALVVGAPEVMIIGGASVYEQALPLASRIYLTVIHHRFPADAFFPKFDQQAWQISETSIHPKDEKNSYDMTFYLYERNEQRRM
ncbi:dihydrofolate reductase [Legionella lansingensis]|uniref:Dihydrofolate reductase n=1 Tax=Legionella lansingensis TaxID=45067 RepID=A0A0W0VLJ8_9GAMM|nr:dihydrofolate reductase [Legionella lansingensis]KTD21013.1 dihydrofolate reductase FolA [Legionella lansingensis]SNV44995.1 dihydrofolate reductase [Legionella lansingensis]